jgi:hypothetical protein
VAWFREVVVKEGRVVGEAQEGAGEFAGASGAGCQEEGRQVAVFLEGRGQVGGVDVPGEFALRAAHSVKEVVVPPE